MIKNVSYQIVIPSDICYVSDTVKDIISFLNKYIVLSDDMFYDIKVVLNEVLINSIVHGNKNDYNKEVLIKVGVYNKKKIYAIIEDEGNGINSNLNILPYGEQNELNLLNENGRGLHIVCALCDIIKLNKKGNKLVLLKNIN